MDNSRHNMILHPNEIDVDPRKDNDASPTLFYFEE